MRANVAEYQERICRCGRPVAPPHCPACGSGNVYGLASRTDTYTEDVNGTLVAMEFPVFRCRRCTATFNFHDCVYHCEALAINSKTVEEKRRIDKAREIMAQMAESPQARMDAINKMLLDSGKFSPNELGINERKVNGVAEEYHDPIFDDKPKKGDEK